MEDRSRCQLLDEIHKLQQRLAQGEAQRLETDGRLVGGVAHAFNNLLTVICGYAEILLADLDVADPLHHYALEIHRAAERAADLTDRLLTASGQALAIPQILDLNAEIHALTPELRRLLGDDIDLETRLDPGAGWVHLDPRRLRQAMFELTTNARAAMPGRGKLDIKTAGITLDEAYAAAHLAARPGPFAQLTFCDTGLGMHDEVLARVGEPFVTTREGGLGGGLGLAAVFGAVRQAGGHVEVDSMPGHGTTIRIFLPHANEPPPSAERPRTGPATVLLVVHDELVRTYFRVILEQDRCTVHEASSASRALEIAETHAGPIDLIIAEAALSPPGAIDLVARLTAARPAIKALLLESQASAIARAGNPAEMPTLQTPSSPDALIAKLREVLQTEPQA